MSDDIITQIEAQIADNAILLYMKGSPEQPMCGFSAKAVQVLRACGHKFAYVNILENPEIRSELPKYANWPTFPQLWVEGELIGGSDILLEMYDANELQPILERAASSKNADDEGFSEADDEDGSSAADDEGVSEK